MRDDAHESVSQASEFASHLGGKNRVLITTHTSPDGDAVASLLAAREILKRLGAESHCRLDGRPPARYDFLPEYSQIEDAAKARGPNWHHVLVVDCGNLSRIGDLVNDVSQEAVIVNVDHHADNEHFGNLNIVRPEAASTTEILFEIMQALHLPISETIARLLYTGLFTDTGGFRFSNATERSFHIAAQLVHSGAPPHEIAEAICSRNSLETARLLGQAASSLELTADGRIATMTVSSGDAVEEMEDLADFAFMVRGVRAAALLRVNGQVIKVSLRARGNVNVSEIARRFGGGGHPKAAGFTAEGSPEEIRNQVIAALNEEIGAGKDHAD